jgi:hypothetical protein
MLRVKNIKIVAFTFFFFLFFFSNISSGISLEQMDLELWVKNGDNWVKNIDVEIGSRLTFKINIDNIPFNGERLTVTVILPHGLEYLNRSSNVPPHMVKNNIENGVDIIWNYYDASDCPEFFIFDVKISEIGSMNVEALIFLNSPLRTDDDSIQITSYKNFYIYEGWNMITVPVEKDWMASDLGQIIQGCTQVSFWNNSLNCFQNYLVDFPDPDDDFVIEPGRGYFVYVTIDSVFSITGLPLNDVHVPLGIGWNNLGIFRRDSTTASKIGSSIPGCTQVSYWNNSLNRFQNYLVDFPDPDDDFLVTQGMGLFVYSNELSIWNQPIIVNMSFDFGWNMITVPVVKDWMASDLGQIIQGCTQLSFWNNSLNCFQNYLVDFPNPDDDFVIEPGRGYFVYVTQDSVLSISGLPLNDVHVPLGIGWNMIGWFNSEISKESEIGLSFKGCMQVSYWNNNLEKYQNYLVDFPDPDDDFLVTQGMGLFVYTNENNL